MCSLKGISGARPSKAAHTTSSYSQTVVRIMFRRPQKQKAVSKPVSCALEERAISKLASGAGLDARADGFC